MCSLKHEAIYRKKKIHTAKKVNGCINSLTVRETLTKIKMRLSLYSYNTTVCQRVIMPIAGRDIRREAYFHYLFGRNLNSFIFGK